MSPASRRKSGVKSSCSEPAQVADMCVYKNKTCSPFCSRRPGPPTPPRALPSPPGAPRADSPGDRASSLRAHGVAAIAASHVTSAPGVSANSRSALGLASASDAGDAGRLGPTGDGRAVQARGAW